MSIKIYDGLKYTFTDLSDVGRFHKKLLNIAQDSYLEKYTQSSAFFALEIALTILAFHDKDLSSYIQRVVCTRFSIFNDEAASDVATEQITNAILNILEKNKWSDDDDLMETFNLIKSFATAVCYVLSTNKTAQRCIEISISLYYNEDSVYMIPLEQDGLTDSGNFVLNRIRNITGVEEYHYQNSSDKPDGIPEDMWEKRLDDWTKATTTYQNHMHFGNGSEIKVNSPTQTSLIQFMYTMNRDRDNYYNSTRRFINIMNDRYDNMLKEVYKARLESTIDTGYTIDSSNWLNTFKYVTRQTNYLMEQNRSDFEKFKHTCDKTFLPLFNYFQ